MRARDAFLAVLVLVSCSREPADDSPSGGSVRDPPTPRSDITFTDVTAESGIDFVHDAGTTDEKHLPETMGAGAAIVDVDEDGDLDLYFVQGGPMRMPGPEPGTFREPPPPLPTNRLYLNDGEARFRDATKESGDAADTYYGMGVAAGDANGDGHVDLFLTNLGSNVLLQGDGHAHFRDVTAASGIRDDRWTTDAAFFDADGDGDLDLFVTSYVVVDLAHPQWCGDRKPGWRSSCHPDAYPGMEDRFWRNRGDGTFEDATAQSGFGDPNGKGLGVIATDVDDDADLDLYVANDSTENRLYFNRGDGTFEDGTLLSGTGVDRYGRTEASMGIASGDVDGDLDFDLFVTGFDDESDTLYVNQGGGVFEDETVQARLEQATRLPVGFGTVLADFDQDGNFEIAVANGHIIDNIRLYHDGKTHAQRALLFASDGGGGFRDVSPDAGALTAKPFVGRGLYSGDLDGDGDLDLVLTQCGGPAVILRNEHVGGMAISIEGLSPGTRVVVKTKSGREIVREAGPQPSYFGQCAPDVHVGLGGETTVSVRVRSPGGRWHDYSLDPPVASGRVQFVRRGAELQIFR